MRLLVTEKKQRFSLVIQSHVTVWLFMMTLHSSSSKQPAADGDVEGICDKDGMVEGATGTKSQPPYSQQASTSILVFPAKVLSGSTEMI